MVKENNMEKWLPGPQVDGPSNFNSEDSNGDPTYISWLEKHPCAISSFDRMTSAVKGKQVVVFLDYDGTLSPIVNDPDRAFMSDPMRSAVREVARLFPTAIISGRSRDKLITFIYIIIYIYIYIQVHEFVKLDEVYYAGSHGMDIMGPPALHLKSYDGKYQTNTIDDKGNETTLYQPAKEYLPSIKKILKELKRRACDVPGAFVEDNMFCISVHYRHVLDEDYGTLEEIIGEVVSEYSSSFHLTRGKKVMEIRPSIQWNKGNALLYLLQTLGFSDSANVLPIYIGDDKTDEDAFKVLRVRGEGYPIIVSSVPRETSASHSLRDTSEVLSFLVRLAAWGEDALS
ncbi:PREDICTED: probable trehalose-phosphate phosphatase 2 [Erythranthe guttata]|uniref:probable trehalose-phosphate phosphatase 2 n=1 Tax=Erythranthe guttata TaxID=4155 RepID=UPI00064E0431|nr:PREDICTED: probable trehalose-phosphate phosphatase 2 [Erythranthe guttata]|eukprot:XP_012851941.1 PREDICTED: probable trehalose-phosphate phosphatase 2 [Erythranthe guttata]